jgi:hypothetical protein
MAALDAVKGSVLDPARRGMPVGAVGGGSREHDVDGDTQSCDTIS